MQKSFRFTNSSIKALPANTDTDLQSLRYLILRSLASNASQVERVTNVSSCATHSTVPKKVSVLADSLKLMWGQPVR